MWTRKTDPTPYDVVQESATVTTRRTFANHFSFISAVTDLTDDKVGIIAGAVTRDGIKVYQVCVCRL